MLRSIFVDSKYLKVGFFVLLAIFASGCNMQSGDDISPDQYVKIAQQSIDKGDPERAIDAYKKAIELRPDDPRTHLALGKIYLSKWKSSYDAAYKKYELDTFNNVKRSQNLVEDLKRYGLNVEYKESAIREFNETLKYSPNNLYALEFLATEYLNSKRFKEAIAAYNHLIKISQNDSNAYWNIADAYKEIGEYSLAIENLERAVKIDNDREFYFYKMGEVYLKMGDKEKAFEMLSILKKMNSEFRERLFSEIYSR